MVNIQLYDILGLVPTYLLPPVEHWLKEAEDNVKAQQRPYSHPDRAPEAGKVDTANDSLADDLQPPRPDKGKANAHARIDSVASGASATTIASASSTVSRAYSSASEASLDDDGESLSHASPYTSKLSSAAIPSTTSSQGLFGEAWHDEPHRETYDAEPITPAFSAPSRNQKGKSLEAADWRSGYPTAATADNDNDHTRSHSSRLRRMGPSTLRCRRCSADFAFTSQIISKGFTARNGPGFLLSPPPTNANHTVYAEYESDTDDLESDESTYVQAARRRFDQRPRSKNNKYYHRMRRNNLANICVSPYVDRSLTTGRHVIAEILCCGCSEELGWKYIDAREPSQKYKIGNFILEKNKVVIHHSWDDVDDATAAALGAGLQRQQQQQQQQTDTDRPETAASSDVNSLQEYIDSVVGTDSYAADDDDSDDEHPSEEWATRSEDGHPCEEWPTRSEDEVVPHLPAEEEPPYLASPPADANVPHPPAEERPSLASQFASAIGLADTDPLASARALTALGYRQRAAWRDKDADADTGIDADADPLPGPGESVVSLAADMYESDMVGMVRYLMHHDSAMFQRLYWMRQDSVDARRVEPAALRTYPYPNETRRNRQRRNDIPPPDIEFDSQDEDECDDLFSGAWDARVVAARRAKKAKLA